MVIDSKEEVFDYFSKLSGAKRIEVLSGIVHSCIPLELRFLASLVESLARKDYVSLLEDEHKANSPHELQVLCSTDLLADVSPFIRFPGVIVPTAQGGRPPASMSPNHVSSSDDGSDDGKIKIPITGIKQQGGSNDQISPPPTMSIIPDVVNTTNYGQARFIPGALTVQPVNLIHASPAPVDCALSNVRKKIVVYLCLLSSTNRVAASVLYEAFRKFLSADNLKRHLELCSINMAGLSLVSDDHNHIHLQDSNQPVVQGSSATAQQTGPMVPTLRVPVLDPSLVAEISLIHTMAIYHPAFQYEHQAFLSHELVKLTELFNNLSPARLYSHHSHQHGSMFIPSDTFVPSYSHLSNYPLSVAECMNQQPKKSPPLCCYNCGGRGHLGNECPEETLDEATRDSKYENPLNVMINR